MEEQIAQEEEKPPEKLDLALKEGQTIKVNINMPKKDRRSKVRISILYWWGKQCSIYVGCEKSLPGN